MAQGLSISNFRFRISNFLLTFLLPSTFDAGRSSLSFLKTENFSLKTLLPLNPDYAPIPVAPHEGPEMVVVGEWVASID